ncbi:hypothetical protein N7523_003037 [Penicillium sp. IBT 18751x]|nr:hypothetical protein N7523_003037 [Penicillium sp. IBT 18751x]
MPSNTIVGYYRVPLRYSYALLLTHKSLQVTCRVKSSLWDFLDHKPDELYDYVTAGFLSRDFKNVGMAEETKDYELTMLEWAKRFDQLKDDVIAGLGEETYRVFRNIIWVKSHASRSNSL